MAIIFIRKYLRKSNPSSAEREGMPLAESVHRYGVG
jgi:hypothetical protein